eukprot:TRINITY_DN9195_c1_g1_i1.p1 TRINITY_DN9195_c1_g1~~TRINITY_DN9195_c1_g1_i1.p1  ORF type:complete len:160 (-),score=8.93 TRINITY_DN9195_c1_g1_i1:754-1233(-)
MGAGQSRDSTYVANGCSETIYVQCRGDKQYDLESSHRGSQSGNLGNGGLVAERSDEDHHRVEWEKAPHDGYTRIAPHENLPFTPFCEKTGEVYVTIYITRNGKDKDYIASCFPIQSGRGVIVDKKKNLKRAKVGYIWKDEDGVEHDFWDKLKYKLFGME